MNVSGEVSIRVLDLPRRQWMKDAHSGQEAVANVAHVKLNAARHVLLERRTSAPPAR